MDLDLSEYDQVDDTKLMLENHENMYCDGSSSKFLVTISSCSDQASVEDANCENDFVFLPAPTKPFVLQRETQPSQATSSPAILTSTGTAPISATLTATTATATSTSTSTATATSTSTSTSTTSIKLNPQSTELIPSQNADLTPITKQPDSRTQQESSSETQFQTHQQQVAYPLNAISTNSNNPFGNYQQDCSLVNHQQTLQLQQQSSIRQFLNETCASKPIGLLEVLPAITNPNKLADLMQQIVTRSDLIFIAIPCAYCHEPVACPPSDISSWLNHMSKQHNCKVCPICTRMIGLGPRRDIEIMKRHVIEHLDEEWLERRASKVSFTFGLQQQWFSGNRCSVKDPRHR